VRHQRGVPPNWFWIKREIVRFFGVPKFHTKPSEVVVSANLISPRLQWNSQGPRMALHPIHIGFRWLSAVSHSGAELFHWNPPHRHHGGAGVLFATGDVQRCSQVAGAPCHSELEGLLDVPMALRQKLL
jgi:hypothetical protein